MAQNSIPTVIYSLDKPKYEYYIIKMNDAQHWHHIHPQFIMSYSDEELQEKLLVIKEQYDVQKNLVTSEIKRRKTDPRYKTSKKTNAAR